MTAYTAIAESAIPTGIRFSTPRQHQGQIIEVSYGDFGHDCHCHGAPYKLVENRAKPVSDPTRITYYQRAD